MFRKGFPFSKVLEKIFFGIAKMGTAFLNNPAIALSFCMVYNKNRMNSYKNTWIQEKRLCTNANHQRKNIHHGSLRDY